MVISAGHGCRKGGSDSGAIVKTDVEGKVKRQLDSPFPTNSARRARSPPLPNGNDAQSSSYTNPTRPLQINRPPSRPTTPSNGSIASRNGLPSGPSRPQRSELRSRQGSDYYSASEQASTSSLHSGYDARDRRDSVTTTRSDASYPSRSRRPERAMTGSSMQSEDADAASPSLAKVMSAFQTAGARKRAMTNGSADTEWEREREKAIEAEKIRQKRIRDKGMRLNGKAKAGDIDAVLDQIKDDWEFVIDPDFNPVDLALQLLDESSTGKDIDSFRRTKDLLSRALKGSVDKHYEAFAASLPHHASLLSHLGLVQTQISDARTALQEAKDSLGTKRSDLVQLWTRGQTVDEMLRILDQIEHLKSVPDVLETLMSEKRLLQASVLLIRSLKIINKPDMLEIGALSDLRSYLVGQETAIRDILIDELHSHLYLKSFWCESRWTSYTPGQQTSRYLQDLALRPNDPPYDLSEPNFRNSSGLAASPSLTVLSGLVSSNSMDAILQSNQQNPESDSFSYIETLLESLAVLGKLGNALDVVAQRLPGEIYSLVEATLDEVAERAEYGRRSSLAIGANMSRPDGVYVFSGMSNLGATISMTTLSVTGPMKGSFISPSSLRLAALESSSKQVDHEILRDLFWTLYSKFDAVSQGLRVVYEVANRIGSRRDFKDSSETKPGNLFPIAEVWAPLQAEMRTLLNDYLNDEEHGSVSGRNPISSINEILRENRFSRDKGKPVFRFADTDMKAATKTLRHYEDDLTRVLRDTVPGLVHGSSENATQSTLSNVGASDDRLLGSGQHHRLLIKPDAFHVSVLFQPTLAFLERLAEVLPSGLESARASSAVLEEFVLKVYLPQLEEKVSELFHQSVTGPDAFRPDPTSLKLSPQPLVKASTELMALINSLCNMLRTTPFHRENYARLILTVIIQFYQRCSDRFQDLISLRASSYDGEPRIALAAQWAQRSELAPCLSELMGVASTDVAKKLQLCRQETHLEIWQILNDQTVSKDDLISPLRNLSSLGTLYHSITWLASELTKLKSAPEDTYSPTTPLKLEPVSAATPYTPYLPILPSLQQTDELTLPLSREMALRFQALLKTYDQLSELMLYSMRIDVRCRTIHYLDMSMREGNYVLDEEPREPDAYVVDLNKELVECEEFITSSLPPAQQFFVFEGLGQLMEHLLISNARHIHRANAFGIRKVLRNMIALQQNLRSLTGASPDIEFTRAKRYYSLFFISPSDMLDSIRQKQSYNFDEYKTMLGLQCGVDPTLGEAGIAKATDRNYNMYVIDLHGLELENSSEDG
ncbi:exocyst complex component sec8 [Gloeophyllum trabeum ATCC 11539]|uniref:Exocyst complex component Sec8 n=1 Tax=Gloeophyllum trabeum (strain ATCC 11539 / FP-39264 / Madison 617) TaxID=670483 RepID=S7QLZ5_GLOTA|nr:exocyst complex component sec8 [Gloeophyllum trabeum ATCC 11539]EPQ60468.1 exocyst complex component sec8 [Gloeophyllum trabeum ATCC 11539]